MTRFCFTCERPRSRAFVCRACGDEECAVCVDAALGLCGACVYEVQSARSLHDVVELAADS